MILRAVPVLMLVLAINIVGDVSVVQVDATSPGGNGKIAFVSDRDGLRQVYTMNADGSDQVNISNSGTPMVHRLGRRTDNVSLFTGQ
jgi:hypothetical protein